MQIQIIIILWYLFEICKTFMNIAVAISLLLKYKNIYSRYYSYKLHGSIMQLVMKLQFAKSKLCLRVHNIKLLANPEFSYVFTYM